MRTPTQNSTVFRPGDFAHLPAALDYAAQGVTGTNFYTGRGELATALSYRELRDKALTVAGKLLGLGLDKGARVAIIAETRADFLSQFFACQYAGLVPVTLPMVSNLNGREAYIEHIHGLLKACNARVALASEDMLSYLSEAADGLALDFLGDAAALAALPASERALPEILPDDVAYIQFTSGSTRFPRGVIVTQKSVMSNLTGIIRDGLKLTADDRFLSWLPYYHDMGMVGLILVPMASQTSVDYLDTRDFAMRPRLWLRLLSETGATISYSPSFGYELCMRRLRPGEAEKYDLSRWRVAGVGAEMIRPNTLARFSQALKAAGFRETAFLSCYGMAETALAVSFAPLDIEPQTDWIDINEISHHGIAQPVTSETPQNQVKGFVLCGKPLPEYETEIRDPRGQALPERHCGVIYVRGDSVMRGYHEDPEQTAAVLSDDGWLNTGDLGYMLDGQLVITGRQKDLIIINGRNIWPQDIEHIAEKQPEIRLGDALAFSVPAHDSSEICVLVAECRETDPNRRAALRERLAAQIRREMAIDCFVELVPIHTLPSTSSGKPSRSKAREQFLERSDPEALLVLNDS